MSTPSTQSTSPPSRRFAILSVTFPAVGWGVFFSLAPLRGGDGELGQFLKWGAVLLLCLTSGTVSAIVSLLRHEGARLLPWLGLLLCLWPVLWYLFLRLLLL